MNITDQLIIESVDEMFSDTGDEISLFDDLLLESLLCQNTLLELSPEQLLQ